MSLSLQAGSTKRRLNINSVLLRTNIYGIFTFFKVNTFIQYVDRDGSNKWSQGVFLSRKKTNYL